MDILLILGVFRYGQQQVNYLYFIGMTPSVSKIKVLQFADLVRQTGSRKLVANRNDRPDPPVPG